MADKYYHWRVFDFTMIAAEPRDVIMTWLSKQENGEKVKIQPLFTFCDNLDAPEQGVIWLTTQALRERDKERVRCSLEPYWAGLVDHIELNLNYYKRRAAEIINKSETEGGSLF